MAAGTTIGRVGAHRRDDVAFSRFPQSVRFPLRGQRSVGSLTISKYRVSE